MLRLSILASVVALTAADICRFNRTADNCPGEGALCSEAVLCQSGLYCKVESLGQNAGSYSGRCGKGPRIEDVYNKPCDFASSFKQCQFDNPLAMSPRALPNTLKCTSSTDGPGLCLLGPQKHGDGCNQESECASGNCVKALKMCQGVDEMEQCVPGFPDPCKPGTYCAATGDSKLGGRCTKVVSADSKCLAPTSCERGTFCAGPTFDSQRCLPMFSVANGVNTTLGPYMCASANAILVNSNHKIFQCVAPEASQVGQRCSPSGTIPMGYECKCARTGETLLRTIGGLGLSARTQAWKDLYKCLMKATDIMGKSCQFDAFDLETMRYGSCGFYGCYPQYLKLVEATGSRIFKEPLLNFEPTAQCEVDSALSYYDRLLSTPCIQIPNMEAWKCAVANGYSSLSVQDTSGVIAFIFIIVWGGYLYHMWRFRRENGVTFPCARLNK